MSDEARDILQRLPTLRLAKLVFTLAAENIDRSYGIPNRPSACVAIDRACISGGVHDRYRYRTLFEAVFKPTWITSEMKQREHFYAYWMGVWGSQKHQKSIRRRALLALAHCYDQQSSMPYPDRVEACLRIAREVDRQYLPFYQRWWKSLTDR